MLCVFHQIIKGGGCEGIQSLYIVNSVKAVQMHVCC